MTLEKDQKQLILNTLEKLRLLLVLAKVEPHIPIF